MEVWISPVGCIIQRLIVPGRKGALADVVLGFDNVSSYVVSVLPPPTAPCILPTRKRANPLPPSYWMALSRHR